MTVSLIGCDDFPGLIGRQDPEWELRSEGTDFSHGVECIKLFERAAGVRLYPWQRNEIMQAFATSQDGRWTHSDVAIVCPRQNGKTFVVEAILLYRLYRLNQRIIFTAQQWKTGQSIRNRLWQRIRRHKKFTARIVRNVNSLGTAEIALDSGAKVQFSTRSPDTGRGLDQVDLLIFDEAYNLDDADMDALLPIQSKASDPQTIYLSTPVNQDIHSFGKKLSELRRKVREELPSGWSWSEYAAPEGADSDSEETWALANPSLVDGPELNVLRKSHLSMSATGFEVEYLGRGRWYEAEVIAEDNRAIQPEQLDAVMTPGHFTLRKSILALDASPDRASCSISVAGVDGEKVCGGLLWHGPLRLNEVVRAVEALSERVDPVEVVIDPKSPAEVVIQPLIDRGFDPESIHRMSWPDVKSSTAAFLAGVDADGLRIGENAILREGFESATLREDRDGGVAWDRQSGVICQIVSLSHAMWAVSRFEEATIDHRPPATPRTVRRKVKQKQF